MIRIDFNGEDLIVKLPGYPHEVFPLFFGELENFPRGLKLGGSPTLDLFWGTERKVPDATIYAKSEGIHDGDGETGAWVKAQPTIVVEVGLSQSLADLAYCAARLLFGSFGAIRLVVSIELTRKIHITFDIRLGRCRLSRSPIKRWCR